MPKAYVSSTFSDLKENRERVVLALRRMRIDALAMEAYTAEPGTPLDRCLADVRESDIYVGIFAWHYGSRPPGSALSYTEHEYRAAVDAGKPCFLFLLHEDANWPRSKVDRNADEIDRLRAELSSAALAQFVIDPDQLAELVVTAVSNHLTRNAPAPSSLGVISAERLSRYYSQLHRTYGRLELDALTPPQQEEYLQIQLAQVFTEQDVRANPPPIELPKELWQKLRADREVDESDLPTGYDVLEFRRAQEAYRQQAPRPVLGVLADPDAATVVLLGDPGAGKSTVARYLTLALAAAAPHPKLDPIAGSLPLLVELKKFVGLRTAGRCGTFLDFLHHIAVEEGLGIERELLEPYLTNGGRAVVVFDGLDEVFDPADRAETSRAIAGFAHRYPDVRIVVTSRIIGYARSTLDNAGFEHFTLQELGERQVEDFLETWYGLALHDRPDDARIRRERLLEAVRASRPIRELTGNPLLLTIMAIIGKHQELPRERWRLYDHAATVLVQHWDVNRHLRDARVRADFIDERDKKELLRRLAYRMQTGKDRATGGNFIDGNELRSVIEGYLTERYHRDPAEAKTIAASMIDQFRERNFVLSRYGPDLFSFVHRTFLEFFCADHIVTRFQRDQELTIDDLRGCVDAHWADSSWREVLRLVCSNIAEKFVGELILHLVDEVNRPWPIEEFGERTPWNMALAIQCLAEVRNPSAVAGPAERLLDALILLIEHGVGLATAETEFLRSDEVLAAVAAVGPLWPGRDRYLNWYRRRGGRITWPSSAEIAGDVLARLFANDPRGVSALAAGVGKQSLWPSISSFAANLAEMVRAESTATLITAVLTAIQQAPEEARCVFIRRLRAGTEIHPLIRPYLVETVRAEPDIDLVEAAADHLADYEDPAGVLTLLDDRARTEPNPIRRMQLGAVLLDCRPPGDIRARLLGGTAAGSGAMLTWREQWPGEPVPDEVLHRVARASNWHERLEALEELFQRTPHSDTVDDLARHALEHDEDDKVFETAARYLLARGQHEHVIAVANRRLPADQDLFNGAVAWALKAAAWTQSADRTASILAQTTNIEEVNSALAAMSQDAMADAPAHLLGGALEEARATQWWYFPGARGWTQPRSEDAALTDLLARRPDGVHRLAWAACVLDDWQARGACLAALLRLCPDAAETRQAAHNRAAHESYAFVARIAVSYLLSTARADESAIGAVLRRVAQPDPPYLRTVLSTVVESEWGPRAAVRLLGARVDTGEFARCRSNVDLEEALLAAHAELADSSTVLEYTGSQHPSAVRAEAIALLHRRGTLVPTAPADLMHIVADLSPADAPELRRRYLQILCELAQDNGDAYQLVRATAHENPHVWVREDAAQLLCAFRAADPADLPDADADFPVEE